MACRKQYFNIAMFCCLLISSVSFAYYDSETPTGFLWYKETLKKQKNEKQPKEAVLPHAESETAAIRNKKLKQKLDNAIQIALDNPTIENAITAQRVQKEVMMRSDQFSKAWMLAALLDQDLLSDKDNPNVLHRKLAQHATNIADEKTLQEVAKDWGLFFYIKPSCIFCERFAPIVEEFAEKYRFQVLAISDVGAPYATFKGAKDTGLIAKINPTKDTPMLYLVHKDGKKLYPVARGLTDLEKIKENILLILELGKLNQ
jgi:conjugal transfer pilus assembly protein TraF